MSWPFLLTNNNKIQMSQTWAQMGNTYHLTSVSHQNPQLPNAIFNVRLDLRTKEIYLEYVQGKFTMPNPLYGCEHMFVERVVKTYKSMGSNLGVMLNGIKGTGKTVTCEAIANALDMPVLIISDDFEGLLEPFLSNITQNVVFFFDEFEKNFSGDYREGSKLLPIMDGVFKNDSKKVFLMTTNELSVDRNLLQRPGRVRYLKTFGNLPLETIIEIIDTRLQIKEMRAELIKFISVLEIITVDIVISLVDEVNIHGDSPEVFGSFFNIKKSHKEWDIYAVDTNDKGKLKEKMLEASATISPELITAGNAEDEDYLYINNRPLGQIIEVRDDNVIVARETLSNNKGVKIHTLRLEPVDNVHGVFKTYAF